MLRGYRCTIPTIVGIAFALSVALAAGFQYLDYYEAYNTPANPPVQPPNGRVLDTARIANALESMRDDQQSADASEREARGLSANEAQARWARWSAYAAVVQFIVSGIGLVALIYTLRQTDSSLRVARRANLIARQIGEAQTRAYLSITDAVLTFDEWGVADLNLTIRNTGQSPARDVSWRFELALALLKGDWWAPGGCSSLGVVGDIAGGADVPSRLETISTSLGGGKRVGHIGGGQLGTFFAQTYMATAQIMISGNDVFGLSITETINLHGTVVPGKVANLGPLAGLG